MTAIPESTAPRSSGRRDQILDQALKIMGIYGYQGLSVKDVAAQCKLTKQGVMHYFPTKEQLLVALLNERDSWMEADLLGLLAEAGFETSRTAARKRTAFRASLGKFVERLLATPDVIQLHVVLRAEATNPEHPAKTYFAKRDNSTRVWLAARASSFCDDPSSMALQTLAAMIGLQALWIQEDQRFDLLAEWEKILKVIIA